MAANDNDIIESSISIKTNSIHSSVTLSDEAELEFERKMWLALAPYYGIEGREGEFRPRDSLMNDGIGIQREMSREEKHDNILKRDDAHDSDVKPAPNNPPSIIRHIEKWFYENKSNPYPATETIEEIASDTGLTLSQTRDWFKYWLKKYVREQRSFNALSHLNRMHAEQKEEKAELASLTRLTDSQIEHWFSYETPRLGWMQIYNTKE
eukprot:scaffold117683_cov46-Cyclotella_meneghiniana.AAC.1